MINLNGYEKIFSDTYPYKIYVLGVSTRETRPIYPNKYTVKRTTHIYLKTHGETLELTEVIEEGTNIRVRINLNKINKFKILKNKNSTQYVHNTNYFIPSQTIISFNKIKDDDATIFVSELFSLFNKNKENSEFILLHDNNLEEVTEKDLISFMCLNY